MVESGVKHHQTNKPIYTNEHIYSYTIPPKNDGIESPMKYETLKMQFWLALTRLKED